MKLSVCKFAAVACLGIAFATVSVPANAQTVNPDDILYLMPTWTPFAGGATTDAMVQAEIAEMQSRIGPDGPYVKLGFTVFVSFDMTDWNVNTADPVAMRKAIDATVTKIDDIIAKASRNGVRVALNILTEARERYDAAQTGSENEDVRSMQWFGDNAVARGWWSTSRYNRKKMAVQEAYVRALGMVLANRMRLFPNTLVAASGDGEVELAFSPNCPGGPTLGSACLYADYSPFAVAEFRDWLRNGGLYATGQAFAGQGYVNAARYAGDAAPNVDTNGDGRTLNGDFGTAFSTWDLLHFNWSLSDANTANAISLATYLAAGFNKTPGQVAGGFDAPRAFKAIDAGDAWWNVWVLFKQTMLQKHNQEFSRWITTSLDTATNSTVSPTRWFSYQIAADYLFGSSPAAPNGRWYSSMSALSTADVSPYGSMGITAFNVDFNPPNVCGGEFLGVVKTLANAAPAISARNARWGLIEWHPGQKPECPANNFLGGFSPTLQVYRDEMAVIEQYGPSYLAPFIWDAVGKNQIKNTPFETALKEMVGRLKDGRTPDPRIATDVADGATITTLPLTFTGSAMDLGKVRGTSHGTGIDQVTITITRKSGGSPTVLTVTYGVTRTDTATQGAQFAKAGFSATFPKVSEGQYDIVITARSTVGAAATTTKTMTVTVAFPLTPLPSSLQFGGTKAGGGGIASVFTAPQVITPTYGGNATPTYVATGNQPWMQVVSGPSTGQFTVAIINPSNVIGAQTLLTGVVTISSLSPPLTANVPVTLKVVEAGASPLPFGSFDTPLTSTTPVAGSIQVSGWALDDVGISRVEIWRDRAAGETTPVFNSPGHLGHGKIYVADVSFVEGARPDIASAFPNNPNAHKAGWGYLMLTQGLFAQGNGTFTFYAFAYDIDGRGASLGSKTVVVSNATSVKPFGNIDQPANGQTLSTADPAVAHWNFGWALTPNATPPCTIINGNVFVSFDSGALIPVSYGGLRTDIQSAFPGYSNANGAGGAYFIDISTLSSGLHQLGWYVVDNCNRAEGIGSRFVNIVRTSGTTPVTAVSTAVAPAGDQPVEVTRASGAVDRIGANAAGVRIIPVAQDERVEVRLPVDGDGGYEGYQVVGGERRALPLGSSLAPAEGVFYWHPAAGFLGAFDLEFVGNGSAGKQTTRVRVVVGPPMRMNIDAPQPGAVVGSSFAVGGWILDLAGENGGVDAIDVWAYPVTPGGQANPGPTYLGSADYGGSRSDVATLYGRDFTDTAFDLYATGLQPGTYDVVVFGRRASTGTFDAVQSVRIVVR